MMGFVLASASPRRLELLNMLYARDIRVIPAREEKTFCLPPDQAVRAAALHKALDVSPFCEDDDIIIAADTLVYLGGEPFGKPDGPEGAKTMLRRLSGREHAVYTGVAVLCGERRVTAAEMTRVFFRRITDREIEAYVATGEPLDKAGSYGAQGRGAVFVERIEGDFFNVMGLPLCRLSMMLGEMGVSSFS